MTNLKDKLSANVRRAKAAQQPEGAAPAAEQTSAATAEPAVRKRATTSATGGSEAPGSKAAKPASPRPRTAKPRTTEGPAATTEKPAAPPSSANQVKESGTALFPDRIWPD
jgi:hypothetical protein